MLLFSEAEVIKEKVKATPVKKGIDVNEMIIYFLFILHDDHSSRDTVS